jgi:hypothetical protein
MTKLNDQAIDALENFSVEYPKHEPINSGFLKKPDEEDFNFWNKLSDIALSAPQGVVNAVEEGGDFIDENIISAGGFEFNKLQALTLADPVAAKKYYEETKASFRDFIPRFVPPSKWKSEDYSDRRQLPEFHKPKTAVGNITEGMARFITGMVGPNKFFKSVGLTGTVAKTGLRGLSAGAVSDLTVFDPNEGRLSDMLIEFNSPVLNNAVTQYLATDENDTEMEGRLKNVLEGMAIGGPLEILFGIKAFKKAKKTQDFNEKQKIYNEHGKAIKDLKKNKKTKRVKKILTEDNPGLKTEKVLEKIKIGEKTAKKDAESFIKKILNVRGFKNQQEVVEAVDQIDNLFDDTAKEYLSSDVLKNTEAEELANILARDKDEILKALPKDAERAKQETVRMLATKKIIQEIAIDAKETGKKYLDEFGDNFENWTEEARKDIALKSALLRDTVYFLKERIRGAARTTQAGNISVTRAGGKRLNVDEMVASVNRFAKNPATLSAQWQKSSIEEIVDSVAKTRGQRSIEVFNSLYINSLLSGVFTHAVNIKSGLYEAVIRPIELIGGGIVGKDSRSIALGFAQYKGMIMSLGDVVIATSKALRQGDAVLDPLSRTQDNLQIVNGKAVRPISGENLGFQGFAGKAIDWFGGIVELPTRLLMTGDELLKQANFRGRMYANAVENTLDLGIPLYSKEGKKNVEEIFKSGFDKNGRANIKNNPIAKDALEYARESTYTNDLKGGSYLDWGYKIQKFLNASPEFRFLMPFIRTPTNLWRHFGNRVPVFGIFTKQMRQLWNSGDRRARAEVLGRQLVGTAVTLYAVDQVFGEVEDAEGNRYPAVTGNGPRDFAIKKMWLQNGWQPYSIARKNDDGTITYVQYSRLDPRFYVYGVIADIKENIFDNINDNDKQNALASGVLAVMANAGNKSYLRGVSDVATVISNPTENLSKYVGNVVGNVIPFASFRSQGFPGAFDIQTEVNNVRSFNDKILDKIGLGNKYLEKRVDVLTGEPIERTPNSLYFNPSGFASISTYLQGPSLVGRKIDVKADPVLNEIMNLKVRLTEPREIKAKTVDLLSYEKDGTTAYQFWVQNIGKVEAPSGRFKGLRLKDALQKVINDEIRIGGKKYTTLSDGDQDFEGGKEYAIKKIYQAYKDYAERRMYAEYPEVTQAVENALKTKIKVLKGN